MRYICFHFQVHQPFRLKKYRFFQIGQDYHYYDDFQNNYILKRIADKCYLPMNNLLLDLIKQHGKKFKVAFSVSGTALEQFKQFRPDVLDSFRKLADTGCVEFLAETYYHSLSSLRSAEEFKIQTEQHIAAVKEFIGYTPVTFRNTEMIYSDSIGEQVENMGFDTMLTEGAKHILGWKSPDFLYCNAIQPRLKLLLRNFKLSDDIAFRFSNQNWSEWPLTAEKFTSWLKALPSHDEVVNLYMDYETFGEHQWAETGIFDFMKKLPSVVFEKTKFSFATPGEISEKLQPVSSVHVPHPISWADEERDITAWLGNDMQLDAWDKVCGLEELVKSTQDNGLMHVWRTLQTSDHFYYMSTKWFSDGDVHKYFNPYNSPYEAYINYMNILSDFMLRLQSKQSYTNKPDIPGYESGIRINPMQMSEEKKRKPGRPPKIETAKKSTISLEKRPTRVKPSITIFDEIIKVADNELKNYIRTLDVDIVFAALQDADDGVIDKILSNITKKALLKYEQNMESGNKLYSEKQVISARKMIVKPFANR